MVAYLETRVERSLKWFPGIFTASGNASRHT